MAALRKGQTLLNLEREKANSLFKEEKYVQALDIYIALHKASPQEVSLINNIALCNLKLFTLEEALHYSTLLIGLDPENGRSFYRRGTVLFHLKKIQAAKDDFEKVLSLQPGSAETVAFIKRCTSELRQEAFFKAIARDILELTADYIDSLKDPEFYAGPKYPAEVTREYVDQVVEYFLREELLSVKTLLAILFHAKNILAAEKTLVRIDTAKKETIVFGDVHGQYFDVINAFQNTTGFPSEEKIFLFNGDIVDRGPYSLECIVTLLLFKILYPKNVFINRGNHEFSQLNEVYGFYAELKRKYKVNVRPAFEEIYVALPLCSVLGGRIFVCHGGLPPNPVTLESLEAIDRKQVGPNDESLVQCILWSDPRTENGFGPSARRAGVLFGPDITAAFLTMNKLDFMIRSHEYKQNGYQDIQNGLCRTIFSAPNYYKGEVSSGAVIRLDRDLIPEVVRFDASLRQGTFQPQSETAM